MRISSVCSVTSAAASILLAACSSSSSTGPIQPSIQLTAAQAQALTERLQQVAASNPGLSDLADSIMVGIRAGVGVNTINLPLLGTGPFYAFGLKRVFSGSPGFGPEFDILAFDNPSDPHTFLLIDVFADRSTPDAANGSFDGSSGTLATGFVFQVSGDSSRTLTPTQGLVSVAGRGPNGDCGSYQPPTGITCAQETMHISFSITATSLRFPGETPTELLLAGADVGGIVLTFSPDSPIQ